MDIKTKALTVIEGMIEAGEPKNKMLATCYKFAHVALGHCGNPHEDWVKELDKTHKELIKARIINDE